MVDIVERLRNVGSRTADEGAHEIEKLRRAGLQLLTDAKEGGMVCECDNVTCGIHLMEQAIALHQHQN